MKTSAQAQMAFVTGSPLEKGATGSLARFRHEGRQVVVKRHSQRPLTLKRILNAAARAWRGSVPVQDLPAQEKCRWEQETLRLWRAHGFGAPEPLSIEEFDRLGEGVLAMEWVEGETLGDVLSGRGLGREEKLEIVRTVLADCAGRHETALRLDEPRLIHFDSNTQNIILSPDGPVHVDFEMGALYKPVERAAGEELAKLVRWMARDMGDGAVLDVARLAVAAYAGMGGVLGGIVRRGLERRMGFWHRWRDADKHRIRPGDVTNMDVARALEAAMESQA